MARIINPDIPQHAVGNSGDKTMVVLAEPFLVVPALIRVQSKLDTALELECTTKHKENERIKNSTQDRSKEYLVFRVRQSRFSDDKGTSTYR